MSPVSRDGYDKAIGAIKKKYGDESVRRGSEFDNPRRIPFDSLELNVATRGGAPMDRWCRFWGGRSSGKSMAAWQIAKNGQRAGLTVAYYNVEKQFDPWFVEEKMGIDVDELEIFEGTIIEEVCDKLETALPFINIHIIDSCSSGISLEEKNMNAGEKRRGEKARSWMLGFQRAAEHFQEGNMVIYIDHQRQSQTHPGSYHPPGGEFMEHQSSLSLYFKRGSWLFYDKDGHLVDDKEKAEQQTLSGRLEKDGEVIQVNVEKSRVSRPGGTANMWLDLGRFKFDQGYEYLKAAEFLGMIQVNGSWYTVSGHKKVQGKQKARALIAADDALKEQIRKEIYDRYEIVAKTV